jgi:Raf kinase inhibitor-like YbhB/YbcL family protein
MKVFSPAFKNNEAIDKKYTCQGEDINPPLTIEEIPPEAKSLALIVEDPDAPGSTFIHWVVFDIPIICQIEENSIPGKQGINDFKRENYGGPCPPSGTHRYFFKVFALDMELKLEKGITKETLEKSMVGHTLAQAEIIGLYKKD